MVSLYDLTKLSESSAGYTDTLYNDIVDESIQAFENIIAESTRGDVHKVKASASSKIAVKKFRQAVKVAKKDPEAAKPIAKEAIAEMEEIKKTVAKIADDTDAELILEWLLKSIAPLVVAYATLSIGSMGGYIISIIFSGISIRGSASIMIKSEKSHNYNVAATKKAKAENPEEYLDAVTSTLDAHNISKNNLMIYYDRMIKILTNIANGKTDSLKKDLANMHK